MIIILRFGGKRLLCLEDGSTWSELMRDDSSKQRDRHQQEEIP